MQELGARQPGNDFSNDPEHQATQHDSQNDSEPVLAPEGEVTGGEAVTGSSLAQPAPLQPPPLDSIEFCPDNTLESQPGSMMTSQTAMPVSMMMTVLPLRCLLVLNLMTFLLSLEANLLKMKHQRLQKTNDRDARDDLRRRTAVITMMTLRSTPCPQGSYEQAILAIFELETCLELYSLKRYASDDAIDAATHRP